MNRTHAQPRLNAIEHSPELIKKLQLQYAQELATQAKK